MVTTSIWTAPPPPKSKMSAPPKSSSPKPPKRKSRNEPDSFLSEPVSRECQLQPSWRFGFVGTHSLLRPAFYELFHCLKCETSIEDCFDRDFETFHDNALEFSSPRLQHQSVCAARKAVLL